ncbi:DUF4365 domain-containing protein [Ilyomonas limi]|nr:DUF4365 domain-containing protein [Ilyomonas limi]
MENRKDFNEWRAEKLGYVYFSRIKDLIITGSNADDTFFDYLIDVGESGKQTGRLFGVKVKALNGTSIDIQSIIKQYQHTSFPMLLIAFDNKTDQGYFTWIKEPKVDGRLLLDFKTKDWNKLDNSSLDKIVCQVKDWYIHQSIPLE